MMDLIIIMPIIAASSVVFLILLKIYLSIREHFPVSVECWFCCKKTKVPFGEANSWDCLNCNQYNGFLVDGDYNRLIPSQYDELLNVPRYTSNAREQCNGMRSTPTLCANCNSNQQMKIAQLAMFLPLNPKNFDLEIEKYSEQLERIYGICGPCEATVAEVLKKQNKLHGLKSPTSEKNNPNTKVQPVSAVKRPLLFSHYATLLLGAVLFYSSTRNLTQVVSLERFIINQLHYSIKILPNFAFVEEKLQLISLVLMNNLNSFYTWIPSDVLNNVTHSIDHLTIGAFIVVYTIELLRMRNTNSLLNTGTWIILLSLKISSTAPEYLISTMQALVAGVFIYISAGSLVMENHVRMKMMLRKGKMKKMMSKKPNGVIKAKAPVCSTNTKIQKALEDDVLISEKTTAKSSATVQSLNLSNILQNDSSSLKTKSHIDFGLSDLSLGPRGAGSVKNHLNCEPRPYCGRLNDQIWSRSTVLSPSRLNMDTVDSPFTTNALPPRSQSLNESSGRGSIASNEQESVCSDRMYDKFTPRMYDKFTPNVKLTVANMAGNQRYTSTSPLQRNYYDLYPASEFSYPALSHYHFTAAQLQRSYSSSTPHSAIFLNNSNSSPNNSLLPYSPLPFYPFPNFQTTSQPSITETSSRYSVFHNIIFPTLVIILVVCNLALLGLVYYKELSVKNATT